MSLLACVRTQTPMCRSFAVIVSLLNYQQVVAVAVVAEAVVGAMAAAGAMACLGHGLWGHGRGQGRGR